jgi:tetratricopeptide (TPR) repeat protein
VAIGTFLPAFAAETRANDSPQCSSATFKSSYRIANRYLMQEQVGLAVPLLEKSHRVCPLHYGVTHNLIVAYMKLGAIGKAKAIIDRSLLLQDRAELHSFLADLYNRAGDLQPAAEEYQKAARLDPTEENIFNLGSVLLKFTGDFALTIFRYGVERYPGSAKLHLGLGGALYGQGLADAAAAEMLAAAELDPEDPHAMETFAAMEYIPGALSDRVTARLAHLHDRFPRNALILYCYAMARSGRWSSQSDAEGFDPIALLELATKLNPRLAPVHFQLGLLYQEQKRTVDSLKSLRRAVKLDPKQEKYHYRLALVCKQYGLAGESNSEMDIYRKLHERSRAP